MEDMNVSTDVSSFVRVEIPTTQEFLAKWHVWIHGKVSKHFKRGKERIPDTAQRVRLRLLSKDFISRWFFKHLQDDLVDFTQAVRMTGNPGFFKSSRIAPIFGSRESPDSIWKIKDILEVAKFDYERYFYSIQNHTIETDKVIRLIGYGTYDSTSGKWVVDPSTYGILESLYRQGRLKPSELTEHECTQNHYSRPIHGLCSYEGCSSKHFSRGFCKQHYRIIRAHGCAECEKGRNTLKNKGVSLHKRWTDPGVASAVSKLRWNDSQLSPFLRDWQQSNIIKCVPRYIMRKPKEASVDAGLLKYANMVIDHDVFNHFKSMLRTDDISMISLDVKADPGFTSSDRVFWGNDEDRDSKNIHFIDPQAQKAYGDSEVELDLKTLIAKASLSDLEISVIKKIDIEDSSVSDVAISLGLPSTKINKIRNTAIIKMRNAVL